MARYDDINTKLVGVVGIVSVLALVGSIIGVQALYNNYELSEQQRKVVAIEPIDAKNLLAEQEAKLNRAGWINREEGIVAIPIDRAMELVVEELRGDVRVSREEPQDGGQ